MGLLGDFALGLAGVALDALTNDSNRNSNANNSGTRSDSGSTTILFDTDFPFSDVETRMEFVKLLLYRAAKILHVPLEENRGIFWDALFDDSLADDFISDFVVTNGSTTIRYGLFGMAQNALNVSSKSVDYVVSELISALKEAGGVDIRRQKGEPQFHNADWLDETAESLYHENSDDDENEEDSDYECEDDEFDGISEDDAVVALLGAFLGGNGEDVSEKDVQVVQAFFQNKFKEEFEAETVKETLLEFAGKFDERSYDMIEAIAENFDDGELNKLWYQLFVVCCAVFEARHSFFRAQFLIKTQEIFGISDEQSDFEAFFVAASRSLNISEDDISAFYTRVQNYTSSKDEMKTRQEIAGHNWQHNIGVNYLERGDNDSLVFMQEFSPLLASGAANAEALNERLIEAAENGVSSAQSVLGYRYLTGKGIKKDELKALNAAEAEYAEKLGVNGFTYYSAAAAAALHKILCH